MLLRLPVLSDTLRGKLEDVLNAASKEEDIDKAELREFSEACHEMHSVVLELEFYCSAYASKEQPKLEELLRVMSTSLDSLHKAIAAQKEAGAEFTHLELAAKVLHRLVSATNRCSHKGFPEIVSYLTKQPSFYCSHAFTTLHVWNIQNIALALIEHRVKTALGSSEVSQPEHAMVSLPTRPAATSKYAKAHNLTDVDYVWRPEQLSSAPLYFFPCVARARSKSSRALPWFVEQQPNGRWKTHPKGTAETSPLLPNEYLIDAPTEKPLVTAPYYCGVREDEAWPVPIVYGKEPRTPNDDSTSCERGTYALWMLLLFHPWRDVERDVLAACFDEPNLEAAGQDHWLAIELYYQNWYEKLSETNSRIRLNYRLNGGNLPTWQEEDYWAVRSIPVMTSMQQSFMRKADREAAVAQCHGQTWPTG